MDTLLQDLRFAARTLFRNRGFTLVAVLTLALGIGANTAIFSVLRGILLKPLPFRDPERVVRITNIRDGNRMVSSAPDFIDWRTQTKSFSSMAAIDNQSMNLTGGADPELGKPTSEQVELPHTGTLTSFCVVNVAFYGQGMEIPYTAGLILLDGADLPMMCLLQEVDVKDVRIGMRLEAVWVDDKNQIVTTEGIRTVMKVLNRRMLLMGRFPR